MRKLTLTAALLAAATLLGFPAPAEATLAGYRWRDSTVCVEDHINDGKWPGRQAVERWDAVPDLRFLYRKDCDNYRQRIELRASSEGRNGRYGYAHWWYTDRTHDYLLRGKITMNSSYLGELNWADRRSAVMHELGHLSGLEHTSRSSSLMNINQWRSHDNPTDYDKSQIERRYPW